MEIKRNIYQKLINWKKETQEHLLLLSGTRYAGNTLVIIDEVQEFPVLYDYIKMSMSQNRTYIICAGSYLNQEIRLNFLQMSDKVESLSMEPLSFQEFFDCMQENDVGKGVLCTHEQHNSILGKIKAYYSLYQILGGYPEIVIMYLKDKDFEKCQRMIKKYTDTWGCESRRYLPDIRENSYVEKVFHILALLMVQNKAVDQELLRSIENIISSDKEEVGLVIRTINFLEEIGVINFDTDEGKNKYYFSDIGVDNYYLSRTGATREEIEEILLEMLALKNTYNYQ